MTAMSWLGKCDEERRYGRGIWKYSQGSATLYVTLSGVEVSSNVTNGLWRRMVNDRESTWGLRRLWSMLEKATYIEAVRILTHIDMSPHRALPGR